MPLLIDGHNLIGSGVFEDIRLEDEDDEERLVRRLRVWRSNSATPMTVIFDRGVTGGTSRELTGAGVRVVFARNPEEADDLIRRRIRQGQRGLVVVTNDQALRQEAALYDVETWRADEFVERMQGPAPPAEPAPDEPADAGAVADLRLSDGEVSEWIDLFGPPPEPVPRPRPKGSAFHKHTANLRRKAKSKKRKKSARRKSGKK